MAPPSNRGRRKPSDRGPSGVVLPGRAPGFLPLRRRCQPRLGDGVMMVQRALNRKDSAEGQTMTTPSSDAGADLTASDEAHLTRLPGTSWRVWRAALLRSAGFPIAGLDRFSALDCAAVADDFLAGRASEQRMAAAFDEAISSIAKAVHDVAAD